MSAIEEYEKFLESGDLFEILPGASGVWEKDKKQFKEIYEFNIKIIKKSESLRKKA